MRGEQPPHHLYKLNPPHCTSKHFFSLNLNLINLNLPTNGKVTAVFDGDGNGAVTFHRIPAIHGSPDAMQSGEPQLVSASHRLKHSTIGRLLPEAQDSGALSLPGNG
ncbi:hypothetical protein L1887_35964 [Cichorium endivia]|nr:hypothetical protein L1887_35964 [Cichorium endivia]